jgi:hypothetical protein
MNCLKKFFQAADWPGIMDLAQELSVRDDPADVPGLQTALGDPLEAYKAGTRCRCGEPIWVLGSAEPGTPASRASRANRTRPKTTSLPRHAISVVSGAAENMVFGRMRGVRCKVLNDQLNYRPEALR